MQRNLMLFFFFIIFFRLLNVWSQVYQLSFLMFRVGSNCHLTCIKTNYNDFLKYEAFTTFVYIFIKSSLIIIYLFSSDKIGIYIDMLDLLKTLTPQFTE